MCVKFIRDVSNFADQLVARANSASMLNAALGKGLCGALKQVAFQDLTNGCRQFRSLAPTCRFHRPVQWFAGSPALPSEVHRPTRQERRARRYTTERTNMRHNTLTIPFAPQQTLSRLHSVQAQAWQRYCAACTRSRLALEHPPGQLRKFSAQPAHQEAVKYSMPSSDQGQQQHDYKQYHVMAKSFLLGSYIDLDKLKPRFADVLRAQGKDYLVMGFRPSESTELFPSERHSARIDPDLHESGLAPLSPDDTYFAVFRYGAVVMFQTVDARRAKFEAQHRIQVSAPIHPSSGIEPINPWGTPPEKWKDAADKDSDGELIYLLLRPFIDQSSDGILFKTDFFPKDWTDDTLFPAERQRFTRPLNESHAHFGNGQHAAQPLMYKESVHLVVCPQQEQFIMQKPDVFYINQLDVGVLRCVASALGQSSALDFYSEKVDAALRLSQAANKEMMQTGEMKASMNFKQIIGYCSLIHGAVISQLGLLDKNDLAWQFAKYDKMVEMFRAEFEMEKRIKNLEDKIAVVARDASTFVSFQHSAKSFMLEWLIAGLITAEIGVSLYDLFGRG